MNCFGCDGTAYDCPRYYNVPGNGVCTYKIIADDDLRKFNNKEKNITLVNMLESHLGIDIPGKVEIESLMN
ncbi:hypothetical protein GF336_00025 [Candidatus Woesearchaeota archaeon]|nr:hypothetical protein [Candidatus Woesearchaeota archaeon]